MEEEMGTLDLRASPSHSESAGGPGGFPFPKLPRFLQSSLGCVVLCPHCFTSKTFSCSISSKSDSLLHYTSNSGRLDQGCVSGISRRLGQTGGQESEPEGFINLC